MLDAVRGVQSGATTPPQGEIGNQSPALPAARWRAAARSGLLGNRDYMDTPFSETTYTNQHIPEPASPTLTDVLAGDPTLRSGIPNGTSSTTAS